MGLLPFSGPPTPSATPTVSGKAKQIVYNVRDYGAVGNGVTDDTTAIQSALTAAFSAGGGIVFVPEATYVVSNITIGSYVELVGAGRGTQLLGKSGASGYMIALTIPASSQQTFIHNLTLKPNTGTLGGVLLDNTGFGTAIDPLHVVEDVVVLNAGGDAFHFDNSMREIQVRGCYAHYTGGYGFYIGAGCTDGRFVSCTVGPSTNHGFEVIGNNNNFVACKAFYAGYDGSIWNTTSIGFHLNATYYSTFTSCSAQQNALHGWSMVSCQRTTITACEADTNSAGTTGGVGFNTDSNLYCVLASNVGANNGILSPGNQAYGLQVAGVQTGTILFGNAITGSSGDFGYVSGFGYILISPAIADFTGIPVKINDVTQFALAGVTSGTTTITPAAIASGTWTLPATTDIVIGRATTDTLTNKTFDTAGAGNVLKINGTTITAKTGTGNVVLANTPGLTTPNIGVATATKLLITTGANASAGTGTLASGTVTISTTSVTANSLIFLTDTSNGVNLGTLSVGTKSAGTSFVVNSSNALDASTFNWLIIN